MLDPINYRGREQAYTKHYFLDAYLDGLVYKVGRTYDEIVYVDGFAGPWQNTDEKYQDTSFGIALTKLRQVKERLKREGRDLRVRAILVEKNPDAFGRLSGLVERYPDIQIETLQGEFLDLCPRIRRSLGRAFAFVFVDPKGFGIDTGKLASLITYEKCEVVFNLMFDFINRFNTLDSIAPRLNELFLGIDWKSRLNASSDKPAEVVGCFQDAMALNGRFPFNLQVKVLKPLSDRTLYVLIYSTRHPKGVEVFRSAQIKALFAQAQIRSGTKDRAKEERTGQKDLFGSDTAAEDQVRRFLDEEKNKARDFMLQETPIAPSSTSFGTLAVRTMTNYVVAKADVGAIGAELRSNGAFLFPTWAAKKRRPDDEYLVMRASRS